MARLRKVERAKRRFLAETEEREWLQGVGIGKVGRRLGLVISVRPGAKAAARRILNRLEIDVPVVLRSIERIQAQVPSTDTAGGESIDALRKAALSRLDKSHQ